jgi:hypothetical protein|eukprot:jgi/Chrpa1/22411/Chrysochromulina_OHIO_Genome00027441-RA
MLIASAEARSRSPTSVVTNHEGDTKLAVVNRFDRGVRIGRENRLRQAVGRLRTKAAQFLKDGDINGAAYDRWTTIEVEIVTMPLPLESQ